MNDNEAVYFVEVKHMNDGRKIMNFGTEDKLIEISHAKVNVRLLKKDEKCTVFRNKVIIYPKNHINAPSDEKVKYNNVVKI